MNARLTRRRCVGLGVLCAAWCFVAHRPIAAQGITTATIRGTVQRADGGFLDGARVTLVNPATGVVAHRDAPNGRFLIQALEVGGPYTVSVQRIGYHPQRHEGLFLHLGDPLEVHFVLQPAASPLDTVSVTMSRRHAGDGGTSTTVSDSLLHRLPTLNRNVYDFVRLAPQISTKIGFTPGGMSGGGVGFRFNNFLIDGVPQRSISGSQPPEFAGGKTLPFEAVAEYQLLVAPFDVSHGDFAGALVNAVTRSGTNRLEGSVFAYGRNDALARRDEVTAGTTYERLQYGMSLGGPIRRDRAHFFAAVELQHFTAPSAGPYVGQPIGATPPVPVSDADLARLSDIMRTHGLVAGSGGPVENRNPLTNVFTRFDLAVPERDSRIILTFNYGRSRSLAFSRPARGAFPLSTFAATQASRNRTVAVQVHTTLRRPAGGHNQFLFSYGSGSFGALPEVRQPVVNVRVPAVTIMTGTPQQVHGGDFRPFSTNINVRNHLTLPLGTSHLWRLGFEAQWFRVEPQSLPNSYGTWIFSSLDALEAGVAERFEVRHDSAAARVPMSGVQLTLYAGDQWRAASHLSVTLGLRADVLAIRGHAPYNAEIDSIFGRRTDAMPRARVICRRGSGSPGIRLEPDAISCVVDWDSLRADLRRPGCTHRSPTTVPALRSAADSCRAIWARRRRSSPITADRHTRARTTVGLAMAMSICSTETSAWRARCAACWRTTDVCHGMSRARWRRSSPATSRILCS